MSSVNLYNHEVHAQKIDSGAFYENTPDVPERTRRISSRQAKANLFESGSTGTENNNIIIRGEHHVNRCGDES